MAAAATGSVPVPETHMHITDQHIPMEPANATVISYTLLRHLGFMLDELSAQGLEIWCDEQHRWHWRWLTTQFASERGFWALGEAIVDAVVTRYPAAFNCTTVVDVE
jgi:hypothetical protein